MKLPPGLKQLRLRALASLNPECSGDCGPGEKHEPLCPLGSIGGFYCTPETVLELFELLKQYNTRADEADARQKEQERITLGYVKHLHGAEDALKAHQEEAQETIERMGEQYNELAVVNAGLQGDTQRLRSERDHTVELLRDMVWSAKRATISLTWPEWRKLHGIDFT